LDKILKTPPRKQSKAKQSKAKQSKAKQSKAKQSKAKQSKAKQSKMWSAASAQLGSERGRVGSGPQDCFLEAFRTFGWMGTRELLSGDG
jgi:hypothetical protein